MSGRDRVQLVVIDDSVRFAFHVWRYLGRSIGIGGTDQQLASNFSKLDKPHPMDTADGRATIWWVRGDSKLPANLDKVLAALEPGPRFFLIDMRGEPTGSTSPGTATKGEQVDPGGDDNWLGMTALQLLCDRCQKEPADSWVMMVSSYETGVLPDPWPLRIWPKSPDTFAQLAKNEIFPKTDQYKGGQGGKSLLHILVTGAGFEIQSEPTGGFGLPSTKKLLSDMGLPFGVGELAFKPERKLLEKGEPALGHKREPPLLLPCLRLKTKTEIKAFQALCRDKDKGLDAWWDYLLDRELRNRVTSPSNPDDRGKMKMLASVGERNLREAFRRIILSYDWGHLNHTVGAAREPWHAWLTTNYTRFADRAIALVEAREGKNVAAGDWQIISTSIEALSLSREILHGGGRSLDNGPIRYLFKLHGDVAHLQTMATAGQDKDFFSSLSLPVDSLHQVYSAAETRLEHTVGNAKDSRLVWHIVGHDLQDSLLLDLIARVSTAHANPESTDFIVVKRKPPEACETLRKFLKKKAYGDRITGYSATAEEYLARIARTGGLPETFEDDLAKKWLEKLGETRTGLSQRKSPVPE
ncbi:MAG: hypothetical protein WAM82_35555 [Thermoanaerobaculia bacterium]